MCLSKFLHRFDKMTDPRIEKILESLYYYFVNTLGFDYVYVRVYNKIYPCHA